MHNKVNYNKSIKDKEKKIIEYYKRKNNLEMNKKQLLKLSKRTKKQVKKNMQDTEKKINEITKLTKTGKLPILEINKQKVVEMN